jgi:hypothetical protein
MSFIAITKQCDKYAKHFVYYFFYRFFIQVGAVNKLQGLEKCECTCKTIFILFISNPHSMGDIGNFPAVPVEENPRCPSIYFFQARAGA